MDFGYVIEIDLGFWFGGLTSGLGDRFCVFSVVHLCRRTCDPFQGWHKIEQWGREMSSKMVLVVFGPSLHHHNRFLSPPLSFYLFSCFSLFSFSFSPLMFSLSVSLPRSLFFCSFSFSFSLFCFSLSLSLSLSLSFSLFFSLPFST